MIRPQNTLWLAAPILLATLSGCGVWDAWRCRWSGVEQPCVACNEGAAGSSRGIQPGHSTDLYEQAPYSEAPTESTPTERIVPPAPSQPPSQLPPSNPDQPIIEQDVQLQPSPETGNKLIKTLKSPRMFNPESVRSIYDRFRGNGGDKQETEPQKPTGPIAQNRITESSTHACLYTAEGEPADGPVRLGLPESDVFPETYDHVPVRESTGAGGSSAPQVMQAGPSSYRHPLLADPTGVPYTVR